MRQPAPAPQQEGPPQTSQAHTSPAETSQAQARLSESSRAQAQPTAEEGHTVGLEARLKLVSSIVAPTTVLTALLFYYGYVSTTAEYGYFGVSVGVLGLATQDFLLKSVGTLYAPLAGLLLTVLVCLWAHSAVTAVVARRGAAAKLSRAARALLLIGVTALLRGVLGILVPSLSRSEPIATSPLCFGVGLITIAYSRHLLLSLNRRSMTTTTQPWPEQTAHAIVGALVTLSLFWAANSFAGAYGRGAALVLAGNLQSRPAVVLDTSERLYSGYPGVVETSLPRTPGQHFAYRYRGLRLLVESNGRLFLVPDQWRVESGATLVVRDDPSVRMQFYR